MKKALCSRRPLAFAAAMFLCLIIGASAALAQSAITLRGKNAPANSMWFEDLDMAKLQLTGGPVKAREAHFGGPLLLGGTIFPHGLGTFGDSFIPVRLNGAATRFMALVGINETRKKGQGSVKFQVWLDGKKAAETGVLKGGDKAQLLSVDLTGAQTMYLVVDGTEDGTDNDEADWGGALFVLDPKAAAKPEPFTLADAGVPQIAHTNPDEYGIHGPRVVGTTPGSPFVFLIPATGKGPLSFSANNLPDGLSLDAKTGIITGSLKKEGSFVVSLEVTGPSGSAKRNLTIIGGRHKLAQTPQMGWNSWNVWGLAVDDQKVRDAADMMVKTGLAAHGFQFINIDDGWEKGRAADGTILTNEKFPDMKSTADYVHSRGLRFGIYSSPGPRTCGGYEASYKHEYQDADSYAKWGVDYLKYDWCSYGGVEPASKLEDYQKPYSLMRDALDKSGRDIVFSFCQYGMADVWKWGAEIGGNSWRTTGDINDSWGSMSSIGFGQGGHELYAGPGHWNDPDMLVVGKLGWGPSLHPSRLTRSEQITHITMWSMLAAPLLIGADLTALDDFTIDLLTNDNVLAVSEDPLGKQSSRVAKSQFFSEVWARPLFDGTVAVALFNRGFEKAGVEVKWSDLGLTGPQPVRDLWLKKDLGVSDGSFSAQVPAHGAVLVKIGKPSKED